jgi:hypothetical protein
MHKQQKDQCPDRQSEKDNPAYAAAAPGSLPVAALWVILKSGQTRLLRKNADCGGKAAAGEGKTV